MAHYENIYSDMDRDPFLGNKFLVRLLLDFRSYAKVFKSGSLIFLPLAVCHPIWCGAYVYDYPHV